MLRKADVKLIFKIAVFISKNYRSCVTSVSNNNNSYKNTIGKNSSYTKLAFTNKITNTTIVPYIEANNYFLLLNYKEKKLHCIKINCIDSLIKIFGSTVSMAKEALPTTIDFANYYVVAIIGKTNNRNNAIQLKSIVRKGKKIIINASEINKSTKSKYNTRPFKLLIINKKYDGDIYFNSSL